MTNTNPIIADLWYDEDYITQPGQGAIYYLSSDKEENVVLVDKDGVPFPNPERKIGFV